MAKSEEIHVVQVEVPVFLAEEEEQWIAFCPSLHVSSYGDTAEEANAAFEEALDIFLTETSRRGTLEQELIRMGWTLARSDYYPPAVSPKVVHSVGNGIKENRTIKIPVVRADSRSGPYA